MAGSGVLITVFSALPLHLDRVASVGILNSSAVPVWVLLPGTKRCAEMSYSSCSFF